MVHNRPSGRTDANQTEIVNEIRSWGPAWSVQSLASIGDGVPDLCVGFKGTNKLFEIKDPEKPKAAQRLTPKEREFHAAWTGQVATITGPEQVWDAFKAERNSP